MAELSILGNDWLLDDHIVKLSSLLFRGVGVAWKGIGQEDIIIRSVSFRTFLFSSSIISVQL